MSTRNNTSAASRATTSRNPSPEPRPPSKRRPAQPRPSRQPSAPPASGRDRPRSQSSLFPAVCEPSLTPHDAAATPTPSVCGDAAVRAHEAPRPARSSRAVRATRATGARPDRADDVFVPAGSIVPPGEPPHPVPGLAAPDGQPRQWEYPAGYNIGRLPRAGEPNSFAELRSLVALYDGIQLWMDGLQTSPDI